MYRYKRFFIVIAFLALLGAIFQFTGLRDHLNLAYMRQVFMDHEVAGVLIFTLLFALGNLLHLPGWLFLVAAVLALGEVRGGVVTYIAAVVSCSSTYWVIRLLGGDALCDIRFSWARKLLAHLNARPVAIVAMMRVLLQTMPTLNCVLAMSGIRFRSYLIGTMLGLPIPIALYCIFFDYLARALGVPGY